MKIRNHYGNLVKINTENINEYDMYIKLWKTKYNIDIGEKKDMKGELIKLIQKSSQSKNNCN
tara:strand:- start:551 stop:736 length:186 start_codon:yes stop_codon:yes gene_type:complete